MFFWGNADVNTCVYVHCIFGLEEIRPVPFDARIAKVTSGFSLEKALQVTSCTSHPPQRFCTINRESIQNLFPFLSFSISILFCRSLRKCLFFYCVSRDRRVTHSTASAPSRVQRNIQDLRLACSNFVKDG